ncbi:MAG: hypothetical protein EA397_08365 [Deltaproteobacteria bacterium]|nr:MAG: hypothetical protein EA397_08365 [Deltaproteobacteria bacterium]
MKRFSTALFLLALAGAACSQDIEPVGAGPGGGGGGGDADTDTDTDTDTDVDTDTDSDADSDIQWPTTDPFVTISGVDCDADYTGDFIPPSFENECPVDTLRVGPSASLTPWTFATTEQGGRNYEWSHYNSWQCHGAFTAVPGYGSTAMAGPERVFLVEDLEPNTNYTVHVDVGCGRLRVATLDQPSLEMLCPARPNATCRSPASAHVDWREGEIRYNIRTGSSYWAFLIIVDSVTGDNHHNFAIRVYES